MCSAASVLTSSLSNWPFGHPALPGGCAHAGSPALGAWLAFVYCYLLVDFEVEYTEL